jgi:hypothetical protein
MAWGTISKKKTVFS